MSEYAARLSAAWASWITARDCGNQKWRYAALNELRLAAEQAQEAERPDAYPVGSQDSGILGLT